MAPTTLASMRASCVRLRDAVDEWIKDFDASEAEARRLGVPMTRIKRAFAAKPKILRGQIAIQIVALCSSDRGATAADVGAAVGMSNKTAASRLGVLALRGYVVRVALPGQTVRFFAHAEHAAAWDTSTADPLPLAAMVEADAPAVAAALAVIAPAPRPADPPPSAPRPAPYIPPTPAAAQRPPGSEAANGKRDADAGIPRPTGEMIVPATAKVTKAPTPIDRRFYVDPEAVAQDGESFSAQWKRLRGEGAGA